MDKMSNDLAIFGGFEGIGPIVEGKGYSNVVTTSDKL